MEKYYLKNCIGSISVTTEMWRSGVKTPSSICGGKGDTLVSQFSLNSLLRQSYCELENLMKVSYFFVTHGNCHTSLTLLEDTLQSEKDLTRIWEYATFQICRIQIICSSGKEYTLGLIDCSTKIYIRNVLVLFLFWFGFFLRVSNSGA